jgi:hypothetical protein
MTAQFDDLFRYRRRKYAVSGISEGELFEPALLELEPHANCTACWRGYQAAFALTDSRLVLDELRINLNKAGEKGVSPSGPEINGVQPRPKRDLLFDTHYVGLNYHLEYTGGLLLADGFIERMYVHMGFHPAWKYKRVVELVFEGGILQQEFDRSEQMAEIRERFEQAQDHDQSDRMPDDDDIARFVERAFDRSYRR